MAEGRIVSDERRRVMLDRLELADAQLDSPLGRTSPIVKLGVAIGWLAGLAFTLAWTPPLVLAGAAIAAGIVLGSIRLATWRDRSRRSGWRPSASACSTRSSRPATATRRAATAVALGPVRITVDAVANGVALALRVVAIASVGAVFTLTTDPTRLADALVRQARLSPRFAYGALAAYQAIPRFSEDLATLRQARRIRGLRGSWHPAAARHVARPRDPPRRPAGAGDGCPGVRVGAADLVSRRALAGRRSLPGRGCGGRPGCRALAWEHRVVVRSILQGR